MLKGNLLGWIITAKEVKMKTGSELVTFKASFSPFARLLQVARSPRADIELEQVGSVHEFSYTNGTLMQADGSLHPTNDKSSVIHLLEWLVHINSNETTVQEHLTLAALVVDRMTAVQELMAARTLKNGKKIFSSLLTQNSKGMLQLWFFLTATQKCVL